MVISEFQFVTEQLPQFAALAVTLIPIAIGCFQYTFQGKKRVAQTQDEIPPGATEIKEVKHGSNMGSSVYKGRSGNGFTIRFSHSCEAIAPKDQKTGLGFRGVIAFFNR
jgi:hypothetical protein